MKETKRQSSCIPLFSLLIAVLSICFPPFFGINSAYAQEDTLALIWSPPELDSTVSYYKIYLSVDTSDYDSIGTSPDTTFSFMGSAGHTYRVKVSAVNSFEIEGALSEPSPDTTLSGVDEAQDEKIPKAFSLGQNFPNPFNSTTAISYQLSAISGQQSADGGRRSAVTLNIYNSLGEKVRDIIDEEKGPGYYMALWNGRDNWGREVCSGIYFYRLEVMGNRFKVTRTKRMIFLK